MVPTETILQNSMNTKLCSNCHAMILAHTQLIVAAKEGQAADVDRLIKSGANTEATNGNVRACLGALILGLCVCAFFVLSWSWSVLMSITSMLLYVLVFLERPRKMPGATFFTCLCFTFHFSPSSRTEYVSDIFGVCKCVFVSPC